MFLGKVLEKNPPIFVTVRKEEKEGFVRKFNGFGLNEELVNKILPKLNVERIRIIYKWNDSRTSIYEVSLTAWRRLGIISSLGGYEKQVFLSEDVIESVGVIRGTKVGKYKNTYFNRYSDVDCNQSKMNNFIFENTN